MTKKIIREAQKFSNERYMTVVMGGDWNCPVYSIELIAGASMPQPLNPFNGDQEDDGIDSMIIFNPVQAEDEDEDEDQAGAEARAEQPLFQRLSLDNARFLRWTGNVSRDDMGGLGPARIDAIYNGDRGGKHRPIIAYIKQKVVLKIGCNLH